MGRKKKPQIFEGLEVFDAAARGKAVAKAPDGRVVFLNNAVPGDVVDVQTGKKRKAFYEGKVTNYQKLSDKRTEVACDHFEYCGGCKWQNMSYEWQLHYKQEEVRNNLIRIGHLDLPEVEPILPCDETYFYRNKMEFSFSANRWLTPEEIDSEKEDLGSRNALGFHISGMWDKILDIQKCHLQEDPSNALRNEIRAFAEKNDISFYNPRTQEGFLRTMMIRIASTGEIMVVMQFFENDKNSIQKIMNHLRNNFPQITSLQYTVNSKGNDSIYDQDIICFDGRDHIFEEMEGLKFKINAKSFYQTNSKQAFELYKLTRDFANLSGEELVYDLYTGTGTIAQFVSKKAKKVVGVESVPEAIADAKSNAKNNQIENTSFFVGDMKDVFTDAFIKTHGQPDVIITDPPRDGMHKKVVEHLVKIKAERIVYVSCNSATQARDLALMSDMYKITRTRAVDMFPQTHHVENIVLLEKIDNPVQKDPISHD